MAYRQFHAKLWRAFIGGDEMNSLIKCNKCGNETKFIEVHYGGYRQHEWTQEPNGRFIFDGSNYDKVDDTFLECGKCKADMTNQYRHFLQALFQRYNEKEHGP